VRGLQSLPIEHAQYLLEHAFSVAQHVVVPRSQDEITHRFEDAGPISIAFAILIVLSTINLQDQFCVRAAEIDYETVDRYLSLEFPAIKPTVAQAKPERSLGIGLIATQTPGATCVPFHDR
jgi:hypothetical protein